MARQHELRGRIRAGVGAVVAIMTVLAAVTVASMLHVMGDYRGTSARSSEHVNDLVGLRAAVELVRQQSAMSAADPGDPAALHGAIASVLDLLDEMTSDRPAPSTAALVAAIRRHVTDLRVQIEAGSDATNASEHLAALTTTLRNLDRAIASEPVQALDHAEATTRATVLRVLILWVAGALVALVVSRRLNRALLPRLAALAAIAARFGDGDLAARMNPGPADEIGRVARTFNRMADRLAAAHAALDRTAHTDELTGLATRRLFWERLEAAEAGPEHDRLALLFVDLDGFKAINDAHGHAVGDEVLRVTSERLLSAVRTGDTVARLGGDEFAVIAPALPPSVEEGLVAQLRHALSTPVALGDCTVDVSASVGAARWTPGLTAESLVAAADAAMYRAKRADRGGDGWITGSPRSRQASISVNTPVPRLARKVVEAEAARVP